MPITPHSPVAFRCKSCGRLHAPGDAGEGNLPFRCRVCDKRGSENWEALADASPDRLAELGLSPSDVCPHAPGSREANTRAGLETIKEGLAHLEAKRAHWQANKDAITAEFRDLDAKLAGVEGKIDALDAKDIAGFHKLHAERDALDLRLKAIQAMEPTARDDAREAHLKAWQIEHEAYLAGTATGRAPQKVLARAADGARTRDRS